MPRFSFDSRGFLLWSTGRLWATTDARKSCRVERWLKYRGVRVHVMLGGGAGYFFLQLDSHL